MARFQKWLPFWFVFPACLAITTFHLIPVILTFIFSFTTMGSETGILGDRYIISENVVRKLRHHSFPTDVIEKLSKKIYAFDLEGLQALRKINLKQSARDEIEKIFSGRIYTSERKLIYDLKRLKNRPRTHFERKLVSKSIVRTVLNIEYESATELRKGLKSIGVSLDRHNFAFLLNQANQGWKWTLDNYREMFASQFSTRILLNTVFYVCLTLLLFNTTFALLLATLTFYLPAGQSKFFRAIWLIPRISPSVIYILVWKWFSYDGGFMSTILGTMGIEPENWLMEYPWTFIILINGFVGASMGLIIFSSAMQAIPKTIFHAAKVDGAYPFQQVFRILLPLMRWPILFVTSYQTLSLLTSWEYIQLSTNGGPGFLTTEVWALHAYHTAMSNYFGNLRYGYGSTLAVVLVLAGIFLALFYLRIFKFKALISNPPIEN